LIINMRSSILSVFASCLFSSVSIIYFRYFVHSIAFTRAIGKSGNAFLSFVCSLVCLAISLCGGTHPHNNNNNNRPFLTAFLSQHISWLIDCDMTMPTFIVWLSDESVHCPHDDCDALCRIDTHQCVTQSIIDDQSYTPSLNSYRLSISLTHDSNPLRLAISQFIYLFNLHLIRFYSHFNLHLIPFF